MTQTSNNNIADAFISCRLNSGGSYQVIRRRTTSVVDVDINLRLSRLYGVLGVNPRKAWLEAWGAGEISCYARGINYHAEAIPTDLYSTSTMKRWRL